MIYEIQQMLSVIYPDSDLDLNEHRVKNSLTPIDNRDLANKAYVDSKIVDTTQFIKKSGDHMYGNLDLNSHYITNVDIDLNDNTTAVPKSYIDAFLGSVLTLTNCRQFFMRLSCY